MGKGKKSRVAEGGCAWRCVRRKTKSFVVEGLSVWVRTDVFNRLLLGLMRERGARHVVAIPRLSDFAGLLNHFQELNHRRCA